MYVTPTGVVGPSGKQVVFLGRPEMSMEITGHYSDVPWLDNDKYDLFFKETEQQLSVDFEVRSLPLWLTYGNLGDDASESRYYNLTWNNCIVQNAGATKRVLLPSYWQSADYHKVDKKVRQDLEEAAAAEWQDIGFQVSWMDDIEDLAYGSGAVHCITKVLRRS